jgi:caffeoyl-CoA O-methyltransferase
MSNKQFGNDDPRIAEYVRRAYLPEDEVLREIRERSAREGLPDIQVAPLDGRHLEVLTRAAGVRRAVEIGTLGGYSGVAILRGMSDDGTLDSVEINPHHAEVARETFRRNGLGERARVHVGSALDVLPGLAERGPFDLVFIDADKEAYPLYLAWAAQNLRRGGVLIGDNAFLFGQLPDDPDGSSAGGGDGMKQTAALEAMRSFHQSLAGSGLFRATVFPTGEGLAVGIRL